MLTSSCVLGTQQVHRFHLPLQLGRAHATELGPWSNVLTAEMRTGMSQQQALPVNNSDTGTYSALSAGSTGWRLWNEVGWVPVLILLLISCVTSGNLLSHAEAASPFVKRE